MDSPSISKEEGIDLLIDALRDYDLGVEYAPGTQFSYGYDPLPVARVRSRQEHYNYARVLWRKWRFGRTALWTKFKRKYSETFSREPWRKEPAIECPGPVQSGAGTSGSESAGLQRKRNPPTRIAATGNRASAPKDSQHTPPMDYLGSDVAGAKKAWKAKLGAKPSRSGTAILEALNNIWPDGFLDHKASGRDRRISDWLKTKHNSSVSPRTIQRELRKIEFA